MKTLGRAAAVGITAGVGVEAKAAAGAAAGAHGLRTSAGALCRVTVAPLWTTTAEIATDPENLSPLGKATDTLGGKGGIRRGLEDLTNLDINTLPSRGHLSTGDDDLKGQIDAILGQDGRDPLMGGIMEGATTVGARLQMSSLENAA